MKYTPIFLATGRIHTVFFWMVGGDEIRVAQGIYMPDAGFTRVDGTYTAGSGDKVSHF